MAELSLYRNTRGSSNEVTSVQLAKRQPQATAMATRTKRPVLGLFVTKAKVRGGTFAASKFSDPCIHIFASVFSKPFGRFALVHGV
jgi:hypothetical protein